MTTQAKKLIRKLTGVVVSDKMNKTRVVVVEFWKKNLKYQKYTRQLRRFKAHDEKNEYKVGDQVALEQTKPLSREKCWRIIAKLGQVKSIERFIIRHPITDTSK